MQRDDLLAETSLGDGPGRLAWPPPRSILRLAADAVAPGHLFGRVAHAHIHLRHAVRECRDAAKLEAGHRDMAHAFDAAGKDNVRLAKTDRSAA